jgi:hypothetical protein
MRNDQYIQDVTAKFVNGGGEIKWNHMTTYRVMKRADSLSVGGGGGENEVANYYLLVEYSYLGEKGAMLVHEGETLQLPLYAGYTSETIKHYDKDRVRIISTVLQYAERGGNSGDLAADVVTIEEDVDKELHEFYGIRKNFHRDVTNYRFMVEDFIYYLIFKKKIKNKREQMTNVMLQVSDYILNDYVFGSEDKIQF